jgi:hypothetical protein
MSWLEALRVKFYPNRQLEAARSTMRRLCGHPPRYRFVQSEPLDDKRVYYQLTPTSARMLGFSRHITRPLGPTALVRRYALQWFIEIDRHRDRWLCDPRDYPQLFSIDGHRLPRANFFIDKVEGDTRLGFALEDYGSDVRRLSRRAVDMLERFLDRGWFDELIAAQRLLVTFLTLTDDKATALARQFRRDSRKRLNPMLRRIRVSGQPAILSDYVVVPGLLGLMPRERKTKERK